MKLLEAEVIEYTTPKINRQIMCWDPMTVKIKQTDENAKIIGKQLQKQIAVYEDESLSVDKLAERSLSYKFEINSNEWLLEGCWLQHVNYFSYKNDSYIEAIVRFDNATEK